MTSRCRKNWSSIFGKKMGTGKILRGGFTIIELIVVISIIAVVIAILLPSLQQARSASRRIVCASNQRSVGILIGIYLNDYDDEFFYHYYSASALHWWSVLRDYENAGIDVVDSTTQGVFSCPSVEPPAYGWEAGDWLNTKGVSFGLQYNWLTARDSSGGTIIGKGVSRLDIKNPQKTVILADIKTRPVGFWIIYRPGFGRLMDGTSHLDDWGGADWHGGGLNILWADFHVSSMSEVELYNNGNDEYFDLE